MYGAVVDGSSRRFFTGLGRNLDAYQFPYQSIHVALPSVFGKTSEGANIQLIMSYQYQLPKDPASLCALYYAWGFNYDSFIQNVSACLGLGGQASGGAAHFVFVLTSFRPLMVGSPRAPLKQARKI